MNHHANRERIGIRRRAYFLKHRDELLAKSRENAATRRDTIAEYSRNWRARNPGRGTALVRAWLKKNPFKAREYTQARFARKTGISGRYTSDDVMALFLKQQRRCQYCCKTLNEKFDVDHIIPLSRGGSNSANNICLACRACNRRKNSNSVDTFMIRYLLEA